MKRKIDILNFTLLPLTQIYPYDLPLLRKRDFRGLRGNNVHLLKSELNLPPLWRYFRKKFLKKRQFAFIEAY